MYTHIKKFSEEERGEPIWLNICLQNGAARYDLVIKEVVFNANVGKRQGVNSGLAFRDHTYNDHYQI